MGISHNFSVLCGLKAAMNHFLPQLQSFLIPREGHGLIFWCKQDAHPMRLQGCCGFSKPWASCSNTLDALLSNAPLRVGHLASCAPPWLLPWGDLIVLLWFALLYPLSLGLSLSMMGLYKVDLCLPHAKFHREDVGNFNWIGDWWCINNGKWYPTTPSKTIPGSWLSFALTLQCKSNWPLAS